MISQNISLNAFTWSSSMICRRPLHLSHYLLLVTVTLGHQSWGEEVASPTAGAGKAFTEILQPMFEQYCVQCHGRSEKTEGEVDLFALHSADELLSRAELIDKLLTAIDSGYMPPDEQPALDLKLRQHAVKELKDMLEVALASQPVTTQTPIRRMNRFQYNNAIVDLFQLSVETYPLPERLMRDLSDYFQPHSGKIPAVVKVTSRPLAKDAPNKPEPHLRGLTPFPQDLRAEHGFDNRGDHLTLSPMLLESFMQLSRSIVESPDFNSATCNIWSEFFAAPPASTVPALKAIAKERLSGFLTRAFRRPVDEDLVDRYVELVGSQLEAGKTFEDAMKDAASAAIASPRFFYIYDAVDPVRLPENGNDSVKSLDDFNLASRLSFFLWGSIPDEKLLDLAASGELHQPAVLRQQVERMLRDGRLKRFCDSFPSQWMQLERIVSSEPDPDLYPQFYFAKYRASMHMMLEPLLLFETVLIENQSILQLIDSDFSYRSDLLEAWYRDGSQGKPGPPTEVTLRRVPVDDRRQGGVITSAGVLTMTSGPSRTKPISRGAWLATVILNSPPPPPPGNVAPLADKPSAAEANLTLRERFVAHRQEPACAGCHQRIDPLGFALENFDAAGIWRDKYENGRPVDASGELLGKHQFRDVVGFKDALLVEKDRFTRALAGHLLSFGLGRPLTLADSSSLETIARETAADDYRMRTLIQQVVLSESFQR